MSKSYNNQERKQSISLDENYSNIDEQDQDIGVISVKEQAKKLNRLNTSTELRSPNDLASKPRNNSISKDLNTAKV